MSENYESIQALIKRIERLESELSLLAQTEGEDTNELSKRIFQLEEKERERARKERSLIE